MTELTNTSSSFFFFLLNHFILFCIVIGLIQYYTIRFYSMNKAHPINPSNTVQQISAYTSSTSDTMIHIAVPGRIVQ